MWGKYHKIGLLELWMNLFKSLDVEDIDVMLIQIINDTIFNEFVTFHTTVTVHSMKPCKKHLSPLEENIICYASGYIPRKLLKRFESKEEDKYATFNDCLLSTSISCKDSVDCTFLEYTKRWTESVNRGGLFEVNDRTFMLFKAIEMALQLKLESVMLESVNSTAVTNKQQLISHVTSDEDVLFNWSLSSVYVPNDELLTDIANLWLTIHGFSLAKEWMERFKWDKGISGTKNKGLRKGLKRSTDDSAL